MRIWRNQVADGNLPTKTPAKVKDSGNEVMESLSKLTKRHHTGRIPQSDWLDRLTFREIELINEREKRTSNYMYLMVEFPRLEYHGVEVHNSKLSIRIICKTNRILLRVIPAVHCRLLRERRG